MLPLYANNNINLLRLSIIQVVKSLVYYLDKVSKFIIKSIDFVK